MNDIARRTMAVLLAALHLLLVIPASADDVIRAVPADRAKLAGIGLPAGEQWIPPDDVLSGTHRPRGDLLFYGVELILEIYEDGPASFRLDEPFPVDEFVLIMSGKLVLTASDGSVQEFVAGDAFVLPKGFTGIWTMEGDYRELVVIETEAYEAAFGE